MGAEEISPDRSPYLGVDEGPDRSPYFGQDRVVDEDFAYVLPPLSQIDYSVVESLPAPIQAAIQAMIKQGASDGASATSSSSSSSSSPQPPPPQPPPPPPAVPASYKARSSKVSPIVSPKSKGSRGASWAHKKKDAKYPCQSLSRGGSQVKTEGWWEGWCLCMFPLFVYYICILIKLEMGM